MTNNNVRIAIRDSTDSYIIGFFDNVSGINYHTADLQRFLAGSSSILTLKYRTKDIDKVTAGCKLAFRYKGKDFWLSIMEVKKNGFDKELTAFSLILEANNEDKGPFSADKGMTMAEYIKKFDAESSLTIGINEVADKSIKLEWTGTDTMLARLFSVANSFGAELEFVTELNNDYSLKRHVLNIYRTGNFGKNATGLPIRVGKELKVINYSESIKNLRTVVFATGKDGLTIEGLSKKVYDDNGELLYETSGAFIRAVQSRDRFPSVGKNTTDNYALLNLGETEYETKEALYGYMLSELKKRCLPEMDFEVEGVIDGDVGDTKTLIDDVFHEPELYVQARISELTESIITGENTNVVLSNYERKYSQIADSLLKQVEALAEDAAPYIVRLSTDNGYNFKNGQGTSTITAKLEKYSKVVNASWKWLINNSVVSETSSITINASQVVGTLNVVAVASVSGNEVAREYITFTNSDDGVGIKSIKRYYTTNDQSEGVTAGGQNWSTKPTTVTADKNYMWSYDVITYTNDTSLVTEPAVIGARGDDGLDADTTGITEALDKAKQELSALSANIEKVRDDSFAAVEEAKQQLTAVANDLSTAKQDLQAQASQLTAQASAQSELTKRVSTVEETANGTKTTVSELSKTVDSNTKNITSVTARTKTVEDDLTSTKTTLSQVQTTANSASQKTATLETGLNGLNAKFESLSVGTTNHFLDSSFETTIQKIGITQNGNVYTPSIDTTEKYDGYNTLKIVCKGSTGVDNPKITYPALAKLKTVQQGKLPDVITISFWGKTDTDGMALCTRLGYTGYEASQNVTLATDWKRYIVHVKTNSVATNEWLFKFSKAGTVWIAKPQFEFSTVASDYHLAEEDTSSKLADYKQTADQNYASLQSNLQNLDGTVKQNKSEFDQTASQLKTSISAVEGKIPTEIGARNYIRSYGLTATGWTSNKAGWKFEIVSDNTAKSGQYLKATCITSSTTDGGFYKNLFDFSDGRFFGKQMTWAMDIKVSKAKNIKIGPEWGKAYLNINATTDWKRYSNTFTVATTTEYKQWIVYTNDNVWNVGDVVYIRDVQLEDGSIATSPVPAIEDTESDITKLNTTLTQTANGLEQLSTQVTSQGNTITSHTNSINSLTTGLSAKVSQTDFNTLSGRVTTAENNITAKANELSSKITSVEGNIPTETGLRNYALNTGTAKSLSANGKLYDLSSAFDSIADNANLIIEFDWSVSAPTSTSGFRINRVITYSDGTANQWDNTIWLNNVSSDLSTSSGSGHYSGTFTKKAYNGTTVSSRYLNLNLAGANGTVTISNLTVRVGTLKGDWQPAPEDSDSKLTAAQSEIKQTTDAISASVSALDSETVKTASLNLDNNGFVTKVGKTVNGNTFATMIAQNESDVQIIAKKMKVSGDMIVNGAITAEKLNVNSLSALSADLGDVTSGSITNTFSSGTRSGNIKIKDNVEITSTDTSNLLPEKAKENLVLSTGSLAMNASTSSDEATHSMLIMPETIKYTKNNYDTTRGGTNGWSLTHNGYYSMLQVDMVWQNVRLNNTSNLMYGIGANYVRIGNLVTISINRQISNIAVVAENEIASEKIPEGFRPISQAHLVLVGGTNKSIDATCIVHLNPDGSIGFTNNKTGNHVWSGTVTYTCVEPMPYVKDLNNGSTI
ncbi:hypothetical protein [Streptococcus gallolyticus]|uniref:Uncharacterized protein n=1 Tax=Streptococcus gallolyticus TaxID=315405 RepID=A0A1H9L8U8_9STRE|nr:hypothetical protein [Streptococcus gallolyticus]SER07607.1 hypothetical protein SAMN04487840_10115 [Streptococcus gallolyticus]